MAGLKIVQMRPQGGTKCLKIGPFPASFFFIFVFSIQLIVHINFADDWIRTADLWFWKRPLYQLRHNHFPRGHKVFEANKKCKHCKMIFSSPLPLYLPSSITMWGGNSIDCTDTTTATLLSPASNSFSDLNIAAIFSACLRSRKRTNRR